MGSILVLGLGNVLQGDDGVGVHIVRYLAGQAPMTGVTVLDGGTIGASLLVELEGVDAFSTPSAVSPSLIGRCPTIRAASVALFCDSRTLAL